MNKILTWANHDEHYSFGHEITPATHLSSCNAERDRDTTKIDSEEYMDTKELKGLAILMTNKLAVHKCVIEHTWVEGQHVPGFTIPKNCIKARAILQDVRLNPMNCELQALFKIQMIFGNEGAKFEGWCGQERDEEFPKE